MKCAFGLCLLCAFVAFGVLLPLDSSNATSAASVTFTKDVAPIIQKNCTVCHRPGEVAPMSFTNYKEIRPWAKAIREKVVSRVMPPWFADPAHGEFSNDPRLSQKEIDTIVAWVEEGAKEGDPKDMPPDPKYPEGWQIGKPDVVLTMPVEYKVPAEGVIPYKYFAVPTNFTEDKYVQFAEIRQGNRRIVHHVIVTVRYPEHGELPKPGELNPSEVGSARRSSGERPGRFRWPIARLGARRGAAGSAARTGQAGQERIHVGLPGSLRHDRRSRNGSHQRRSDLLQTACRKTRHHGGRFAIRISRFRQAIPIMR